MPGCLGLDAMWQLVGFYLAWAVVRARDVHWVPEKKFFGQVLPENKLVRYHLDIKRLVSKLTMAIADGRMEVDGREIYTAKDLRVGLFHSTDDFRSHNMRRVVVTGMGIVSSLSTNTGK